MTDLRRQQFEAHMRSLPSYSLFRHGQGYVDASTQEKWALWQSAWHAALASQQPADDGWIEWGGGSRPVEYLSEVEIRLRGGTVRAGKQAGYWSWQHTGSTADIIAYRVVKP